MPYPILSIAHPDPARQPQCAFAIMAKAPRPGKVKTRLCPPLTPDQSAALNICFLKDTAENLAQIAASGRAAVFVSYTPVGDEALFEGLLPCSFTLIGQRGNGFGERLLAAAEDILACGFGSVCLVDSDSPTVPAVAFESAVDALSRPGDRIVIGASHDGGYYLIGLKQPHAELFQTIRWSTSTVFADTIAAAESAGIAVVRLPLWYDVDDGETLDILAAELIDQSPPSFATVPGYLAAHSRRFLSQLRTTASSL